MVEKQVDEILLLGIKAELVSMEECWNQMRGKGFGKKLYVSRRSAGAMYRG